MNYMAQCWSDCRFEEMYPGGAVSVGVSGAVSGVVDSPGGS